MLVKSHTSPTFMECMRYGKSALHLSHIIFINVVGIKSLVCQSLKYFNTLFHNNNIHCIPSDIFSYNVISVVPG